MLRSRVETPYCYPFTLSLSTNFKNLAKKLGVELTNLFQMHDSTEKEFPSYQGYVAHNENRARGTIKALFWMIIAICLPLVIGI